MALASLPASLASAAGPPPGERGERSGRNGGRRAREAGPNARELPAWLLVDLLRDLPRLAGIARTK